MTKTTTITALAALSLSLSSTATAGSGIALESILVNGNNVRVEYSSKIRDCSILVDEDGDRAQASPRFFCRPGQDNVVNLPYRAFNFVPGDTIEMCALHNPRNCTDSVEVRAAGDVNGDGSIDIIDLMIMHSVAMGEEGTYRWPNSDLDELAADMNDDGAINVIDILLLLEAIKGSDW